MVPAAHMVFFNCTGSKHRRTFPSYIYLNLIVVDFLELLLATSCPLEHLEYLRMGADRESSWSALDWSRSSLCRSWTVRWCKTEASSWQWVKISEAKATNDANCRRQADNVWLLIDWRGSTSKLFVVDDPSFGNRLRRTGVTCRKINGILNSTFDCNNNNLRHNQPRWLDWNNCRWLFSMLVFFSSLFVPSFHPILSLLFPQQPKQPLVVSELLELFSPLLLALYSLLLSFHFYSKPEWRFDTCIVQTFYFLGD